MVKAKISGRYVTAVICLCVFSSCLASQPDTVKDLPTDSAQHKSKPIKETELEETNKQKVVSKEEDDKRASFNSWGGKREADKKSSFNAWGGKRSEGETDGVQERERRKFAAWGGKRAQDAGAKLREYMARRSFNSWGGKRNEVAVKRPFNAWGGKRSFSSWGGKRSDAQLVYKRPKFQSWGGKRNLADSLGLSEHEKRAQFNAWGGKRTVEDEKADLVYKRPSFQSWGGKRSTPDDLDIVYESKRPKFNSWGGKRSSLEADQMSKRPQFSSWGGKRSDDQEDLETSEAAKRARFNSWGGKRASFQSWGGKKRNDGFVEEAKRKFNSWGGKRSQLDPFDPKRTKRSTDSVGSEKVAEDSVEVNPDEGSHSIERRSIYNVPGSWSHFNIPMKATRTLSHNRMLEYMKRNFNPWGGKRSGSGLTHFGGLSKSDVANFAQLWEDEMGDVPEWNRNEKRGWSTPLIREEVVRDDSDDQKELLNYLKRRSFRPWGGK